MHSATSVHIRVARRRVRHGWQASELIEYAKPLVAAVDAEQTKQALIDYKLLDNTPRVTRVVKDIIRQTNAGRVETLFVAQDAERWGVFDPETQQVRTHVQSRPGDESLLNLAAVTTLLDRGQVFVLPRSGGAVLQYRISHPATASTNEGIRQR